MSTRKRFIQRRSFSCLAILILLALMAVIWVWRVQLQAFPTIISAYTAKEYCSCRYVMNHPADYCESYVKQWLPSTLTESHSDKRITASGLGRESSAQWQGARQGCRLLPAGP
ncbi:amidase [Pseudomonas sp. UBA1879]|uniref:amidase n=1 Tax=Pseudomonas sp. UBA1879 TaxID=1947305 RepID=UPI0025E8925F|nr:amidase [Pseudomonas sp. UBA1879]